MLIEFRVENHRSLRDEQVLTMEAGRVGDDADPRPRQVSGYPQKLLSVAALYGANASGKSNVLNAFAFMRDAVLLSHRSWAPDGGVPREPFAWGPTRSKPSMFEIMMLIDGIRYQYGFVANDECILEEWLHAWPKRKKRVFFERDGSTFKFGEELRGENKLIQEVTRANSLFISAATQNNHLQLGRIFSWFQSLQAINLSVSIPSASRSRFEMGVTLPDIAFHAINARQRTHSESETPAESLMERFVTFLKNADTGIVGVKFHERKSEEFLEGPRHRIQLKHQSESEDGWLPLEQESRGTQTLFRVALPILQAIQEGGAIIVDELEASLHPTLAQQVIRQFNDPATNPRNAQVIFTTHDTNLLGSTVGEPTLRRDQVWLTEKDHEGATVLYPLTDYKPRKAENLERGYLQGRYGAIPFLGDFSLAVE